MTRTVAIGHQNFETIRIHNYFYIDKTDFIREWWESGDAVTLITRPRRFGKTLNMSMVEQFFSVKYAKRTDLFEGLSIWQEEGFREIQGTYPVLSLSFANIKEVTYEATKIKICQTIEELYNKCDFLLESGLLNEKEKEFYQKVSMDMEDYTATLSLRILSDFLSRYYGKNTIILLDEYDTPMQEAYVNGYWGELVSFTRSLFNAAFKTNPYLERAIMTGITRVSKESVFSDLNNLKVVTTTSEEYAQAFGFTEQEVFLALDEYGFSAQKQAVKSWYDGFAFGGKRDIYNPWSIINYLDIGKLGTYWANSSSNSLVSKLIREGTESLKKAFEGLISGGTLVTEIDEQIVYSQLDESENAIWSLLLASGYLKVKSCRAVISDYGTWKQIYELELTNFEVKIMFQNMIRNWFASASSNYNEFIKALLSDDIDAMNVYMNRVALATFSYFDTGSKPSWAAEPERFYHGFVLGLMVELNDKYLITSNRESGFGRYDVVLEPRQGNDSDAVILEFKVFNPEKEVSLEDTVQDALSQIDRGNYAAELVEKGFLMKKIRKYGFAFQGKKVLVSGNQEGRLTPRPHL